MYNQYQFLTLKNAFFAVLVYYSSNKSIIASYGMLQKKGNALKNSVRVHDTVYNDIDSSTMSSLNLMFGKNITVTLAPPQKQQGDSDCGAFSITITTSLQHGLIPGPYMQALL